MGAGIELIWPMMGEVAGYSKFGNKLAGSIKCGEYFD
jgi:hypothetical protein